jgi:hypothetical protein
VRTLSPKVFPAVMPPVPPKHRGLFVTSRRGAPSCATFVARALRKCAESKHAAKTGNDCRVIDLRKLTRLRSDGTTRRARWRARALQRRRPPDVPECLPYGLARLSAQRWIGALNRSSMTVSISNCSASVMPSRLRRRSSHSKPLSQSAASAAEALADLKPKDCAPDHS